MNGITVRVDQAAKLTGLGRTKIYEKLNAGDIAGKKDGKTTLVLLASLKQHIESLPEYEPGGKCVPVKAAA